MLGLDDLKQTRFYQEAHEEGKLETKLELIPYINPNIVSYIFKKW